MKHLLLVKYAEVHLKGQNRPFFQQLLVKRIREAIRPHHATARLHDSRILVSGYTDEDACIESVRKVFGVHSVCPAVEMGKEDFQAIQDQAVTMMADAKGSFKVLSRRADKRYFLDSPQISAQVGGYILEHNPNLRVDVHEPEHLMNVEIRDNAFLYAKTIPAVGGMPVGSNGKAALLLSGGIDSPVAGYRIAKRGVMLCAVYFHSFPYTGEASKQKVASLAKILSEYAGSLRLLVVPFTEIQQAIHERCNEEYTTLLMRRSMMRIAEKLAQAEGAQALITGECIGQVASQTMEALVCTDAVVTMPVFRPLIGMDKLEIIREAEQIGTYETSCLPYEDCCTVFTPRHPITHPKLDKTALAEAPLTKDNQLEEMIKRAIEGTEVMVLQEGDEVSR